jgi:hypothetical protein
MHVVIYMYTPQRNITIIRWYAIQTYYADTIYEDLGVQYVLYAHHVSQLKHDPNTHLITKMKGLLVQRGLLYTCSPSWGHLQPS